MDPHVPPTQLGNILVATDFSQADALERALLLRVRAGASITLLHVLPPDLPPSLERGFARGAERLLDELVAGAQSSVRKAGLDADVFRTVIVGRPVATICQEAERVRASLVVLGRTGLSRALGHRLGATAERVARACPSSVLVVAGAPRGPYRAPLVAVDGGEPAAAIVERTLEVAAPDLGALTLAHAFDAPELGVLRYVELTSAEIAELTEQYAARARRHIDELLPTLPAGRVGYEPLLLAGDPRRVLVAEASRRGADLIAVGTHGRGAVMRLLLGSVAEAVLRDATSDVLVVR